MKIAFLDAQEGLNSNLINYFIQHTSHDLIGTISRSWNGTIPHLVPAMQAKNRFSYHWTEGGHFISPPMRKSDFEARERYRIESLKSLFLFEKVDLIIASNEHIFSQGQTAHAKYASDHLVSLAEATKIPIVYLDSLTPSVSLLPGIKTLCIPGVFGPRMFDGPVPTLTQSVLDEAVPADPVVSGEWIYVKDVFFALIEFLKDEAGGNGQVAGYKCFNTELYDLMASIGRHEQLPVSLAKFSTRLSHCRYAIKDAVEHTMAWYAANPWIRNIQ